MTPLKFVFMGTPIFAFPAFDAMIAAGHEPLCVYSQPPRPAGRGRASHNSPMIEAAKARNVESRTPKTLKDIHETQSFLSLTPDVVVVAAYGLILPKEVLEAPRLGCINIHASLLPRWRGAAPIQRSIMARDRATGITIMFMDKGLDTGPILAQRKICIFAQKSALLLQKNVILYIFASKNAFLLKICSKNCPKMGVQKKSTKKIARKKAP